MKVDRAPKLKLMILSDIVFLSWVPNGKFKNFARRLLMKKADLSFYSIARKGDVVVQGGCFMIETVRKWSDAVGVSGKVIVIEADKKNVDILKEEISRRNLSNVILVHSGLWDKKDTLELDVSDNSNKNKLSLDNIHSKILTKDDYKSKDTIDVDCLDNILTDLGISKVNAVYLTVSGAEREVLEGMNQLIDRCNPLIWIRCSFFDSKRGKHTSLTSKEFLESKGYKVTFKGFEMKGVARNLFAHKK